MIYEFAIDPRMLSRWLIYRDLVQDCGVEHGRLISDFPNRWKKMVWEAVMADPNHTPLDEQRIEYDLQHSVPNKLIPPNRRYDFSSADWLAQAEREHTTKPFRAVVSNANPRGSKDVIVAEELDKANDARWMVKRDSSIERKPAAFATLAKPLFKISRQVRLVDPHFTPEEPRFQTILGALLDVLAQVNPNIHHVELHLAQDPDREFIAECQAKLSPLVPRGMELHLVRWRQRPDGEKLHARYILTERGGIQVDVGLDAGHPGEHTDVHLLSEDLRRKHWSEFELQPKATNGDPLPTTFEFKDELRIRGV